MGLAGHRHTPAALPPVKGRGTYFTGGLVGRRVGLEGFGKSRSPGFHPPDRLFISESLYRLGYPGPHFGVKRIKSLFIKKLRTTLSSPITGLDSPWGFQQVEAPRFQDSRHMKVERLSTIHTGRLYLPGNIPGTRFCWRLSRHRGHSYTIGNRNSDLPCNAVPQPTAPRRASLYTVKVFKSRMMRETGHGKYENTRFLFAEMFCNYLDPEDGCRYFL